MRLIGTDGVAGFVGLSGSWEPCKNRWTDRHAVWEWDVDSGRPKEICFRWGCKLAPSGEYDWIACMRRRCRMSNYFDHLLLLLLSSSSSSSSLYKCQISGQVIWRKAASSPHTDGSITITMWRQYVSHLVGLHHNWHPHLTDAAPCWVALSTSTAWHVRAWPGPVPFRPQSFPFTCGDLDPI